MRSPSESPGRDGTGEPVLTARRASRRVVFGASLACALIAAGVLWRGLNRPDPDRIWRMAEASIQAGRADEANRGLRLLASLRSRTAEDWLLQAQVSSALGNDDDALAALAHVPDNHPLSAQAWYMAGRLEIQKKRLRRAEAAFRRAIELDSGLVKAHQELVYLFGMQLRREEVDAEFKVLSRLSALSHHDLFTWCLTHFTGWGPDIADDLESFVAADPGDRHSRLALAKLLIKTPGMEGRVERALEPLPADDPEAIALRIELAFNHGRIDNATAMLEGAPAGHPSLERLRRRVALAKGDHRSATLHFRNALTTEPYDRVSLTNLGKALLLSGDNTAAAIYLDQARRLDDVYDLVNRIRQPGRENQTGDLKELAGKCESAGLLDEARGWYRLATSRDPLDGEAQRGLYRLRHPEVAEQAQACAGR